MTSQMLAMAEQAMAKHGVTPVDACVTLRHDDIPTIIEAADAEAAAAAGTRIAVRGNFQARTVPATSVTDSLY